jgi:hypothetical protein
VLAQIARELLSIMQRDVKTDWTFRDDVRAKLRSSIKRLLVRYITAGQAARGNPKSHRADGRTGTAVSPLKNLSLAMLIGRSA